MINLKVPISEKEIRNLKIGDTVYLNGIIVTARDAGHKYMIENFINKNPPNSEMEIYKKLKQLLKEGVIYHCGPVVKKIGEKWSFVAAGPTTSIREEIYEDKIIEAFNVRAIIGKGGMGDKTLEACKKFGCVYLHAVGGAASLIAKSVKEVVDVFKLDFGVPEAFWVIRVENFPCTVTMDTYGNSLHNMIQIKSNRIYSNLIQNPS